MMSIRIMQAVWEDKETSGSERLVLLSLADNANDEGFCWPSMQTIADKCNIKRRQVLNIIGALEEKGLIERERRSRNGMLTSNMYRVVVHKVAHHAAQPATPRCAMGCAGDAQYIAQNPSINPQVNPNEIEDIEEPEPSEPEPAQPEQEQVSADLGEQYAYFVEQKTGNTLTKYDMKVADKWAKDGILLDDIKSALKFFADNGITARGPGHIDKSVRRNRTMRIQAENKSLQVEQPIPSGRGRYKTAAERREEANAAAFAQAREELANGKRW